jgi:hypothetical protein
MCCHGGSSNRCLVSPPAVQDERLDAKASGMADENRACAGGVAGGDGTGQDKFTQLELMKGELSLVHDKCSARRGSDMGSHPAPLS